MNLSKYLLIYGEGLVLFEHDDAAEVKLTYFEWFCAAALLDIKDLQETVLTDS